MIRVMVVEDRWDWAAAVTHALERERGIAPVGVARTVDDALEMAAATRPHVALVDLLLGDESGLRFARVAAARHPGTAVVMMSMQPTRFAVDQARECGARGFIHKDDVTSAGTLARLVARVANGEEVVTGSVVAVGSSLAEAHGLSDTQREVLRCLRRGHDYTTMARHLHIAEGSAKNAVNDISRRVGVTGGRTAVLAWYLDQIDSGRYPGEVA